MVVGPHFGLTSQRVQYLTRVGGTRLKCPIMLHCFNLHIQKAILIIIYQDRRLWSGVFPPSPDIGCNRPRTAGLQENQRRRGVRNMGVWTCASSPSTVTFII